MKALLFLFSFFFLCLVNCENREGRVSVLLEVQSDDNERALDILQSMSQNVSLNVQFPSGKYTCDVSSVKFILNNRSRDMHELLKPRRKDVMVEGYKRFLNQMSTIISEARIGMQQNMRVNLARLFMNYFTLIQKGLMAKIKSCDTKQIENQRKDETAIVSVNDLESKKDIELESSEKAENMIIDGERAEHIFLQNTMTEISITCNSKDEELQKQLNFVGSFSKCSFSASSLSNSFFQRSKDTNDKYNGKSIDSLEAEINKRMEDLYRFLNGSKNYYGILNNAQLQNLRGNSSVVNNVEKDNAEILERNKIDLPKQNELFKEYNLSDLNGFKKILEDAVKSEEAELSDKANASVNDEKSDNISKQTTEILEESENFDDINDFGVLTNTILTDLAKVMQEGNSSELLEKKDDANETDLLNNENIELETLDQLFDGKPIYDLELGELKNVADSLTEQILNEKKKEEKENEENKKGNEEMNNGKENIN